jgi:hypothetical protein
MIAFVETTLADMEQLTQLSFVISDAATAKTSAAIRTIISKILFFFVFKVCFQLE